MEDPAGRKERGAYFTPPALVAGLLDLALDPVVAHRAAAGVDAVAALRIADPACGTGNLLVAAVERLRSVLVSLGLAADRAAALAVGCVRGTESDAATARACRGRLRSISPAFVGDQVVVGDGLLDPSIAEGSVDVVLGNPPFLNQLRSSTTRSGADGQALRARFGSAVGTYTDPAALFLVLGHRLARPDGGVVAMIEPTSVLTSRDAGAARRAVIADGALRDLWLIGGGAFDASVEVCAVVVERGASMARTQLHGQVPRAEGALVAAPTVDAPSWSALLAAHAGLPVRDLASAGVLGDVASATADFRDQYYGLIPHVVDRPEADDRRWPRLVTTGSIDPAHLSWGERPTRFAKQRFQHPRIDRSALPPPLAVWADARSVPKVLLATQTRVLEAVVDATGGLLPSVPVISVVPTSPDDLWRVAAVLTCPPVAVEAARRHLGSGRSSRAVRLRAAEVVDLPLPAHLEPWTEAADLLRAGGDLAAVGAAMDAAYGLADDDELLGWWLGLADRAPTPRR